jgi:hypothetical protein
LPCQCDQPEISLPSIKRFQKSGASAYCDGPGELYAIYLHALTNLCSPSLTAGEYRWAILEERRDHASLHDPITAYYLLVERGTAISETIGRYNWRTQIGIAQTPAPTLAGCGQSPALILLLISRSVYGCCTNRQDLIGFPQLARYEQEPTSLYADRCSARPCGTTLSLLIRPRHIRALTPTHGQPPAGQYPAHRGRPHRYRHRSVPAVPIVRIPRNSVLLLGISSCRSRHHATFLKDGRRPG